MATGEIQGEVLAFVMSFGDPNCKPEWYWQSQVWQYCSGSQNGSQTFKYIGVWVYQTELRLLVYCFVCIAFFCQLEIDTLVFFFKWPVGDVQNGNWVRTVGSTFGKK